MGEGVFLLHDPPFGEKNLIERPLALSCCPSTPVTFKVECPPPPFLFLFICYIYTTLLFFSSSCLVMRHEVIYYDNSIDKEGHEGCILYRPNWCNLPAFLPWGVHRLSFVFQLSPSPMSQPSDLPTSQGLHLAQKKCQFVGCIT